MIVNVHFRDFAASQDEVGSLIDSLGSKDDRLWPSDRWPAMRFEGPLRIGAAGGHGPIRYTVEEHEPGRKVRFRFTAPPGFDGAHGFEIQDTASGLVRLHHDITMLVRGPALFTWTFVFRPLHDALLRDLMDRAEVSLTGRPAQPRAWPLSVRFLRWALRRVSRR